MHSLTPSSGQQRSASAHDARLLRPQQQPSPFEQPNHYHHHHQPGYLQHQPSYHNQPSYPTHPAQQLSHLSDFASRISAIKLPCLTYLPHYVNITTYHGRADAPPHRQTWAIPRIYISRYENLITATTQLFAPAHPLGSNSSGTAQKPPIHFHIYESSHPCPLELLPAGHPSSCDASVLQPAAWNEGLWESVWCLFVHAVVPVGGVREEASSAPLLRAPLIAGNTSAAPLIGFDVRPPAGAEMGMGGRMATADGRTRLMLPPPMPPPPPPTPTPTSKHRMVGERGKTPLVGSEKRPHVLSASPDVEVKVESLEDKEWGKKKAVKRKAESRAQEGRESKQQVVAGRYDLRSRAGRRKDMRGWSFDGAVDSQEEDVDEAMEE
ncbi:hypothetical protein SLS58_009187 [Diplodia intermedia]|uniref:Uncharacterized protein n=1 Tax=Diplodia intermedia TaxID=856260 RepID=A0ABR3TE16_9PEZI